MFYLAFGFLSGICAWHFWGDNNSFQSTNSFERKTEWELEDKWKMVVWDKVKVVVETLWWTASCCEPLMNIMLSISLLLWLLFTRWSLCQTNDDGSRKKFWYRVVGMGDTCRPAGTRQGVLERAFEGWEALGLLLVIISPKREDLETGKTESKLESGKCKLLVDQKG